MKKLIMLVYALLAFSSVDAFSMQFEGLITSNVLLQTGLSNFNLQNYSKEKMNHGKQSNENDSIKYLNPVIVINPMSLEETHLNPPMITTQTITVTNTGDETLNWDLAVNTNPDANTGISKNPGNRNYCDASTQFEDEYISNILCGEIDNTSGWQGGVADYTDISTIIEAGSYEEILVTNGNAWAGDIVYCWADWDQDFEFEGGSELFMLTNVGGMGEYFTGNIFVPSDTPEGQYRFRIRMTYSTAPEPCGEATYGEVEDYTIIVGIVSPDAWLTAEPLTGTLEPGQSTNITVTFNSNYLPPTGSYSGLLIFTSNDPVNPVVDVPAILVCGGTIGPLISVDPESFYFHLSQNQTETQFINITNGGDYPLLCNMDVTIGTYTQPVTSFDVEGHRRIRSNAFLGSEAAPGATPANGTSTTDAMWDLHFAAPASDRSVEACIETETQNLVSWLSVPEGPFYVNPNSTISVSVICHTEDLPENLFYYASIWIANNSINNPMVEVPVNLELITGIVDASGDSYIMMYPNPTTDFVNIRTNSNISQVRIFNQAGQLVLNQNVNGSEVRVETNILNTGIYFVEITSAAGVVTSKLIVK